MIFNIFKHVSINILVFFKNMEVGFCGPLGNLMETTNVHIEVNVKIKNNFD